MVFVRCSPLLFVFSISLTIQKSNPFVYGGAQFWQSEMEVSAVAGPGCLASLTESIPENLTYPDCAPQFTPTFLIWDNLLRLAYRDVNIASFYWTLHANESDNQTSIYPGAHLLNRLMEVSRSINVTVVQNGPKKPDTELDNLAANGANVHWLDVKKLVGAGVLHTKMWLVDNHAYLGSANMDWRSLTQVKELGVVMYNCPELVSDLRKIWQVYWYLSEHPSEIPDQWPSEFNTIYNRSNPIVTRVNGIPTKVFFSSSPPQFNPPGRSNDLDTLLSVISDAKEFIYISVMSYLPEIIDYSKSSNIRFWPVIDDALRKAAIERKVEVRLLISLWPYTRVEMLNYLESLKAMNGIRNARFRVRLFVVPSYSEWQRKIPHARVNHNKYMVTDAVAYIGTSNWSGDYYTKTGGVSVVFQQEEQVNVTASNSFSYQSGGFDSPKPTTIRQNLHDIFIRDWDSEYAVDL